MKKVLVFSNFGGHTGVLGGQTIKVRHIYSLLESKKKQYDFELDFFDTDIFKKKFLVIPSLFSLLVSLSRCNVLIFVGSKNNLKYFFPFLYLICIFLGKEIHYIVVGGWLNDFLKENPRILSYLRRISGVYPQTSSLCKSLTNDFLLNNVHLLNNFRMVKGGGDVSKRELFGCPRLVFMARVSEEKGVNTLFKLAEEIQKKNRNITIDIYGPIAPEYKNHFEALLSAAPTNINYCGIARPDRVHDVLFTYSFLVFPTIYSGEGFPGSVLDSYIAGIPVVASGWKYASEFIEDGKTGLISEFGDEDDFIRKAISLIEDPEQLKLLTENASKESAKYSPEAAWDVLEKNIFR